MRVLLIAVAISVIGLTGCESEPNVNSWETPEALKRSCLYSADIKLNAAIHLEGSENEIASKVCEALEPCRSLDDDTFIEIAKEKIAAKMKDPSSVQFKDTFKRGLGVVGRYNAKNGYGAYTGFKPFEVELSAETGEWYVKPYD